MKKENELPKAELKVELERGHPRRFVPSFVVECDAKLYEFQQVDVALEQLVLVIGCAPELPDWPSDHSRELCVLIAGRKRGEGGREGGRERERERVTEYEAILFFPPSLPPSQQSINPLSSTTYHGNVWVFLHHTSQLIELLIKV